MPEARPTNLRSDAARNRALLIDVARRTYATGGSLQLNAIAREAGVGIGTAYRHFPSQEAFVEALGMSALEDLLAEVAQSAPSADTAAALRDVLLATYRALRSDPALAAMLTAGTLTCSDTAAVAQDLMAQVQDLLARARDERLVRPDVGADDLRRLICGMSTAAEAGPHPVGAPERYAEILLAGLRPA